MPCRPWEAITIRSQPFDALEPYSGKVSSNLGYCSTASTDVTMKV
jgi:hypothetical protein